MTNHKITVLMIEDEKAVSQFITAALESAGYRTVTAATGNEGLSLAASLCPDVVLLKHGLPDMDGHAVISRLRDWAEIPIIVVSSHAREEEMVRALDLGADDYVTRPFGTRELLARIRSSLRRGQRKGKSRVYRAGGLEIDYDKRLVTVDGEHIHLTQIEYKLLSLLSKNAGKVITYASLMEAIWGPYTDSDNQILRVNMTNIRHKIEKDSANPQYVRTEAGIGYRMPENEGSASPESTRSSKNAMG